MTVIIDGSNGVNIASTTGVINLLGSTSGAITLQANVVAGTNTLTLPAVTGSFVVSGQNSAITQGTAQNSTSGTSIDFTGIPSWVKRVTFMFQGLSTNGTSAVLIRLGTSGGFVTTGYLSSASAYTSATPSVSSSTAGFLLEPSPAAVSVNNGMMIITNITGNSWVEMFSCGYSDNTYVGNGGGSIALAGTLTQLRLTTANGTDTFDAGSINILYE
jgi:hypothetical protein